MKLGMTWKKSKPCWVVIPNMTTTVIEDGLKVTDKPKKIHKDNFYGMLSNYPNGITLTVKNITKPMVSQFQEEGSIAKKMYCFIDYEFVIDDRTYTVGLSYDLGYEMEEGNFKLVDNKLRVLLEMVIPTLQEYHNNKDIVISKSKIDKSLTGIKFVATSKLVKGNNNGYYPILKPVELL